MKIISEIKTYDKCVKATAKITKLKLKSNVLIPVPQRIAVGIARYKDGDVFDKGVGTKIAVYKAKRRLYKLVLHFLKFYEEGYLKELHNIEEDIANMSTMSLEMTKKIKELTK